jgi:VWFA-related protein
MNGAGTLIMRLRAAFGLTFVLAALRADDSPDLKLLDLNVIALDAHDQPVNDLKIDDFQVTDAGKQQKIVFFRHRDATLRQSPKLAPNEVSNRGGAAIPYATVILFDLMNESFGTRGVAANDIVHTLESLENAENLYLYILTIEGRLFPVRGLAAAEEGPDQAHWTKQIKPRLDTALRTVLRTRPAGVDVAIRTQLTFAALDSMGLELSRVPGRKNIVWVTDGVPIGLGPNRSDTGDFVDFTPQLRLLSQAFERSGVAIYPVRQVLLGTPDRIGGTSAGSGATGGTGMGLQSMSTLDEFANVTGGRPNAGTDIGAALKQAMNDVRVIYQIGYYAPERNWDNKYHKVRVTCRRKGVRIQSKTGYYAWAVPPGEGSEQAIRSVISTEFDAAEIGLHGTFWSDSKVKRTGQVNVRMDAGDIAFAQVGDHFDAQLRLAVVSYFRDGRVEGSDVIPFNLHYSAEERDKARKDGVVFSRNVPILDQIDRVRLIVFDRGSNAIGSLTMPLNASIP